MSGTFHEVQFPTAISYGAVGGPGFKTTILSLAGGYEKRNIEWSRARARYDVAHALKTQADLDTLIAFFYARKGRAYGFRFQDWSDYQLPNPEDALPVLFTTNGTTSTFQLTKVYADTWNNYVRTIVKPQAGTLQLFISGSPITGWTVDTTTGIVTLPSAIYTTTGEAITGSCQFDTPVRFDTDELKARIDDYQIYTWGQIPLVEVRDTTPTVANP